MHRHQSNNAIETTITSRSQKGRRAVERERANNKIHARFSTCAVLKRLQLHRLQIYLKRDVRVLYVCLSAVLLLPPPLLLLTFVYKYSYYAHFSFQRAFFQPSSFSSAYHIFDRSSLHKFFVAIQTLNKFPIIHKENEKKLVFWSSISFSFALYVKENQCCTQLIYHI